MSLSHLVVYKICIQLYIFIFHVQFPTSTKVTHSSYSPPRTHLHDNFSARNFIMPQCIRSVPCMRHVNAIQKVSTTARWRSIFMYSHQFSFTRHIVEVRFAFDQVYKRWRGRNSLLGLTTKQNLFTLDYKTEKITNGIDWESNRNKYGDIWERYSATGESH